MLGQGIKLIKEWLIMNKQTTTKQVHIVRKMR